MVPFQLICDKNNVRGGHAELSQRLVDFRHVNGRQLHSIIRRQRALRRAEQVDLWLLRLARRLRQ